MGILNLLFVQCVSKCSNAFKHVLTCFKPFTNLLLDKFNMLNIRQTCSRLISMGQIYLNLLKYAIYLS